MKLEDYIIKVTCPDCKGSGMERKVEIVESVSDIEPDQPSFVCYTLRNVGICHRCGGRGKIPMLPADTVTRILQERTDEA